MSTSRPTNLAVAAGICVVLVGLMDLAISRKGPRHFLPAQKMSRALAAENDCILLLGDSRMAAGYAEEAFRAGAARTGNPACSVDLALGGTDIRGAYLTTRRFLRQGGRAPLAVVGISADSVLDPEATLDPQEMVGNNAIHLMWSDASDVFAEYRGFPLASIGALDAGWRFLISRGTALGQYQSILWLQVQKLQSKLAGRPQEQRNDFGLVADMRDLELTFRTRARDRIAAIAASAAQPPTMTWFNSLADLLHANHVALIAVELPVRDQFRRDVLDNDNGHTYARWLDGELAARDVRHLDMSRPAWLDDGLFADPLHLNARGARLFSEDLAERLTKDRQQ